MPEVYYEQTSKAQKLTLPQLAQKFVTSGLPCKIEPEDQNMSWLAFDPLESDILASVADGVFVFGTFHFNGDDPASLAQKVDEVMESIGFCADEEGEI